MQARRIRRREPFQVEAGEDVEHQERREPLTVGRAFVDLVTPIGGDDGLDVIPAMRGEVLDRVETAIGNERRRHVFRRLAPVERRRSVGGDSRQGSGKRRLAVDFSRAVGAAVAQVDGRRFRRLRQQPLAARPVVCDTGVHDRSVGRQPDGRGQKIAERLASVVAHKPVPRLHRARNVDRMRPDRRHLPDAVRDIPADFRRRRAATGAVIGNHPAAGRRVEHETIAADPGHLRLDDGEHRRGRNRRIHRVAAGFQRVDGGQRGERVRRRRHAAGSVYGRPSRQFEIAHCHASLSRATGAGPNR